MSSAAMSPNQVASWAANGLLLLITLIWGATFTLTKNALARVDVDTLMTMRFILAGLALLVILAATRRLHHLARRRTWTVGVALGIILWASYVTQTMGLETISPSLSGFVTGLNVVLVPLLAVPIVGSRLHRRVLIAAWMALAGLTLLSGLDFRGLVSPGSLETILCAVFVALQIVLVEKWGRAFDSLVLAAVEVWVVAVCCAVTSAATGSAGALMTRHTWTAPPVLWATLINGLLATSFALWVQNAMQRFTSAAQAAIIFSMEPVFAAIIAWLVRGDAMTGQQMLGGLLVLGGMFAADPQIRIGRRRPRPPLQRGVPDGAGR